MGVYQNSGFRVWGTFLGGPHKKDYGILGSILGPPLFGKLPTPKLCVEEFPDSNFEAEDLHSRKLTWKPKKGPIKTRVLLKGVYIWVSMLVWGSVPLEESLRWPVAQ